MWGGLYPRALSCYLGLMFSPSSRMSNTATSEHLPYASLNAKGSRESLYLSYVTDFYRQCKRSDYDQQGCLSSCPLFLNRLQP